MKRVNVEDMKVGEYYCDMNGLNNIHIKYIYKVLKINKHDIKIQWVTSVNNPWCCSKENFKYEVKVSKLVRLLFGLE